MKAAAFAIALIGGVLSTTAQANLITNGNFTTGDFTGWNLSINPSDAGYVHLNGSAGGAWLGTYNMGFLSQSFSTVAGATYQISFNLVNPGTNGTSFTASLDSNPFFSVSNVAFPKTNFTFDAVASGTTTKLTFGFKNIPDYFTLGNVSVVPVPEPETYVMMLMGLSFLGFLGYKRRLNADLGTNG
jgi:hypothetical protein